MAQQRPCHLHRRLPACYRDLIPEPPRPLPPSTVAQENPGEIEPLNLSCLLNASPPPHPVPLLPSCPKIKTQLNTFGLFQLYDKDSLPLHDPDIDNLLDGALSAPCKSNSIKLNKGIMGANNPYYPYPNETSLLLGDWYWNQGHQKSQVSFKKLLNIVGHLEYYPKDVQNTNWVAINRKLGNSAAQDDPTEEDCEWLDGDSGWKMTAVQICTPFHCRTQHPGSKNYVVEDFHYHSLMDIIHENVSNPTHHQFFHYEPYKLHWQPPHKTKDVSSVLKSGPVRFLYLFWHNWTATSLKNSTKPCNCNCNHMQPVAYSCVSSCDWFLTQPVADCKKTSLDQVIQVSNFSFHTIYLLSADYWLVCSLYGTRSNLFLPALVNTIGMYYWYVLVLCLRKCLYRVVY